MERARKLFHYVRIYKFRSILLRNFTVTLVLLILPLAAVTWFVYRYNEPILKDEIGKSSLNELTKVRDTVDMIVTEADRMSIRIGNDPDVDLFLREPMSMPRTYTDISRLQRIQQILGTAQITNPYLGAIYLHSERNQYVITADEGRQFDLVYFGWLTEQEQHHQSGDRTWVSLRHSAGLREPVRLLGLFRLLPYADSTQRRGTLVVYLNFGKFDELMRSKVQNQRIYIIDGNREFLYSSLEQETGNPVRDPFLNKLLDQETPYRIVRHNGGNAVVSMVHSAYNRDWSFVSVISLDEYRLKQEQFKRLVAIWLVLSVVVSFVVAIVISLRTYQPIRRIISLFDSTGKSAFYSDDVDHTATKRNEIKYIMSQINRTFADKKEMEEELNEKYRKLRKAQAIALQSQINPHFLFNTLETINWKVMRLTKGKNEASGMIQSLSRLLRLSLETEEELILLRKELEQIRLYMEIQMFRYKDKLNVQWFVSERVLDYKVIKLLIQPIVENAIYHGIKPSPVNGVIKIAAYEKGNAIVISVKDNGIGMSKSEVARINAELDQETLKGNRHIGLYNVHQRIRLAFGSAYGLKLTSRSKKGTIVVMTLPKI